MRGVLFVGVAVTVTLLAGHLWLSRIPQTDLPSRATVLDIQKCVGPSPPCPMTDDMVARLNMKHFEETDGGHNLRWLADRANCTPSSVPSLMAGCIAERLDKVRFKARLYKGMYDDLKNLDREYFARLREEGLVPMTVHVPK